MQRFQSAASRLMSPWDVFYLLTSLHKERLVKNNNTLLHFSVECTKFPRNPSQARCSFLISTFLLRQSKARAAKSHYADAWQYNRGKDTEVQTAEIQLETAKKAKSEALCKLTLASCTMSCEECRRSGREVTLRAEAATAGTITLSWVSHFCCECCTAAAD